MDHAPPETETILNDIRRIVRVLRESSRAAEAHVGLSGAQLFVLQKLKSTGVLSVSALADQTLTHQSTVSVVVKRLDALGLVSRTRSSTDARCIEVRLTPEGENLLRKAPEAAQERLIEGITRLDESERQGLALSLRRLVETMGIDDRPADMFFEEAGAQGPSGGGNVEAASKEDKQEAAPRTREGVHVA